MEHAAKIDRWSPVEIKTILVTTDLRPESMIALRYALTLAKQFDANLTLLNVLEEPYTSDTELEPGAKELPVLRKCNEERELALLEEEIVGTPIPSTKEAPQSLRYLKITRGADALRENLQPWAGCVASGCIGVRE